MCLGPGKKEKKIIIIVEREREREYRGGTELKGRRQSNAKKVGI